MSVTIDLPSEIEESLTALAQAHGLPLPEYLNRILAEKVSPAPTPAQRAQMWRDSVKGLPDTAPLSDEAISRESMYGSRG